MTNTTKQDNEIIKQLKNGATGIRVAIGLIRLRDKDVDLSVLHRTAEGIEALIECAEIKQGIDDLKRDYGLTDTTKQAEFLCTQTDDASVWAKEFCKRNPSMDEGNMIGWFANAIECSSDIRRRKWDDIAAAREHKIKEEALTRQIEYEKRANDCVTAWMQKALDATGAQRIAEIALNCHQERELAIVRADIVAADLEQTLSALRLGRLYTKMEYDNYLGSPQAEDEIHKHLLKIEAAIEKLEKELQNAQ